METAIAYIRVSGTRQLQGTSLEVQRLMTENHVDRSNYTLDRIFVEKGESAKTSDRTGLKEMLDYIRANRHRIDVLVVPKLDRFIRTVDDWVDLKRILKPYGVRFESIGEQIDETPVGRFNGTIMAGVAQLDNEIRAERCKAGMVQAVHEGRWVWQPPFGYKPVRNKSEKKKGDGTIEPDPIEGSILTQVFIKVAERSLTVPQVQGWLKDRGFTLSYASVHRMLRNKVYMGVIEAFGGVHKAQPPFVPLVTPHTFFRVQDVLLTPKSWPKKYQRENPDFPLRGTIRCGCGAFQTANWSQGRTQRYPYYHCKCCSSVNNPRDTVEIDFATELAGFRPDVGRMELILDAVRGRWKSKQDDSKDKLAKLKRQLEELSELEAGLSVKTARGVIPDVVARQQFEAIGIDRSRLEHEKQLSQSVDVMSPDIVEFAREFLLNLPEYWKRISLPHKKKLQSFLYPTGWVYTKENGFRTADYPLLEQVKQTVKAPVCHLVDPMQECPNHEVLSFFQALYDSFGNEGDETKDLAA